MHSIDKMFRAFGHTLLIGTAALLLAVTVAQAADSSSSSSSSSAAAPAPRVRVSTNMGDFVIELFPDRVPITVANFLRYVREGQYTHVLFHRVIANFVIQGGGYDATTFGLKPTHEPIPNESGSGLQNKRGMVGLARASAAHSGNCQFYINLADNTDLDPLPTRWGYAVFGRIVDGMDVIDRIAVTPTGAMGPFKADAPLKPVIIEKIELLPTSSATAEPAPVARPANSSPAVESPK